MLRWKDFYTGWKMRLQSIFCRQSLLESRYGRPMSALNIFILLGKHPLHFHAPIWKGLKHGLIFRPIPSSALSEAAYWQLHLFQFHLFVVLTVVLEIRTPCFPWGPRPQGLSSTCCLFIPCSWVSSWSSDNSELISHRYVLPRIRATATHFSWF